MKALVLSTFAVTAAMCGPEPKHGEAIPGAGGLAPTFESIQVNVLAPSCATSSCHSGNPPPFAPLSLDPDTAYDQLVGQPSLQDPSMPLVDPGNPANSYLLQKLLGAGGGSPMPLGAPPLDDDQLAAIETWIQNGAVR